MRGGNWLQVAWNESQQNDFGTEEKNQAVIYIYSHSRLEWISVKASENGARFSKMCGIQGQSELINVKSFAPEDGNKMSRGMGWVGRLSRKNSFSLIPHRWNITTEADSSQRSG